MRSDLFHLQFSYDEAIQSRREILELEIILLQSLHYVKNYTELRKEEFKLKEKLKRKLTEAITNIKTIQEHLPRPHIPEKMREAAGLPPTPTKVIAPPEEVAGMKARVKEERKKEKKYVSAIEAELAEIKARLQNLQV